MRLLQKLHQHRLQKIGVTLTGHILCLFSLNSTGVCSRSRSELKVQDAFHCSAISRIRESDNFS